jgi:F-type H+-transporting ATPase subunit b
LAKLHRLLVTSAVLVLGSGALRVQAAGGRHAETGWAAWMPTIAKVVNFSLLVGLLVYFLRRLVVEYFRARSETIGRDLVEAANLRRSAEARLDDVRTRAAALPGELETLRAHGREELAIERRRLAEATAREREKLVERVRREIEFQFQIARRELVEHTAALAMKLAAARVERDITPDDQLRLIDRYAAEVGP